MENKANGWFVLTITNRAAPPVDAGLDGSFVKIATVIRVAIEGVRADSEIHFTHEIWDRKWDIIRRAGFDVQMTEETKTLSSYEHVPNHDVLWHTELF